MSIIKKLLPLSLITSLFLFSGCGGGASTPSQDTEITEQVTVPQTISIDIPDALKSDRTSTDISKVSSIAMSTVSPTVSSYGYNQLQSTINEAESTITDVKDNLGYLSLMMPDILNACKNTPKNETCTIEEGIINLNVENQTLSMGKIEYTQQDDSNKYQQIVVLDLTPTLMLMDESSNVEQDIETVKWSTDENHIETISDFKSSDNTFNMHLFYDKEEDGTSSMMITDNYDIDNMKGNFSLTLNDKNDLNNTIAIETIGRIEIPEERSEFSSQGIVSDNGGYLVSRGSLFDEEFAEKETFDKDGMLEKLTFCHSLEGDCTMQDENTWNTFDDVLGFDNEAFDNSDFENSDFEIAPAVEYFALDIIGGNVPKDSTCALLQPNYNTSTLSQNTFENSVADIFLYSDGDHFGFLNNANYNEQLNTLPMVCMDEGESTFYLRPVEDRPTITLRD